jgi:hypothetical protein
MNFGFNQRNTRRTAVVMLFVWMMSLMVGFANACVLNNDDRSQGHAFVVPVPVHELEEVSTYDDHSRDDSVALGACKSFCSAEETGISKYSGNTAPTHPSTTPLLIQTWINPATNFVEAHRFADSTPNWSSPPVHIRFLRLTI